MEKLHWKEKEEREKGVIEFPEMAVSEFGILDLHWGMFWGKWKENLEWVCAAIMYVLYSTQIQVKNNQIFQQQQLLNQFIINYNKAYC